MLKVNNKNAKTTSLMFKFEHVFTHFSCASIVDYEQVNVSWVNINIDAINALNILRKIMFTNTNIFHVHINTND